MATMNPFDLLGDDDTGEISGTAQSQAATQAKSAKLPSKPLPPAQAVREAKNEGARGGGRGGRGYGRGRGGSGGYRRDSANDENSFSNTAVPAGQGAPEDGEGGKPSERRGYVGGPRPYRGGRRGGFSNGDDAEGERPRRMFERRSGTGRGNELKREGSGRGNWGTPTDELAQVTEEGVNESEKNLGDEKPAGEEDGADANKENPNESEEKEPEDKEMTLEEYEKVLEEKRKALQALKTETEERKVDTKEFESMQQLSNKKSNDEIFIKLGSDKDKKKEAADKEERAKKSLSINEFLKPAEGERYYNPGGRGRGRGRGSRGFGGGNAASNVPAPSIEDPGQFPTLGGK
ncbi:Hyaluronan/mRNA-binding protein [Corchorus capsularis]|uniref:Hyaluronan/mRNA-binding protein n=1 Tax=Corchorus capsularis TaxID=210143 RepID=A0A1R3HH73_COCAP|nr:Hyaluronan/mRNA-binding protein [Corchorus capsularis]